LKKLLSIFNHISHKTNIFHLHSVHTAPSAALLGLCRYWPCRDGSNPYASHCFDWRQ
jgi:hypothetical protein